MTLGAHTITKKKGSARKAKRVGRGNASGKGTYASRGLKGQRSRSGGKSGTQLRGFRQSLQKIPKLRGFKSLQDKAQTVTLATLARVAPEGGEVTKVLLEKKNVIKDARGRVKIVATGSIDKAVTVKGCLATKSALELIEKAGGKVIIS